MFQVYENMKMHATHGFSCFEPCLVNIYMTKAILGFETPIAMQYHGFRVLNPEIHDCYMITAV